MLLSAGGGTMSHPQQRRSEPSAEGKTILARSGRTVLPCVGEGMTPSSLPRASALRLSAVVLDTPVRSARTVHPCAGERRSLSRSRRRASTSCPSALAGTTSARSGKTGRLSAGVADRYRHRKTSASCQSAVAHTTHAHSVRTAACSAGATTPMARLPHRSTILRKGGTPLRTSYVFRSSVMPATPVQ